MCQGPWWGSKPKPEWRANAPTRSAAALARPASRAWVLAGIFLYQSSHRQVGASLPPTLLPLLRADPRRGCCQCKSCPAATCPASAPTQGGAGKQQAPPCRCLPSPSCPTAGTPAAACSAPAGMTKNLKSKFRANLEFGTASNLRVLNLGHAVSWATRAGPHLGHTCRAACSAAQGAMRSAGMAHGMWPPRRHVAPCLPRRGCALIYCAGPHPAQCLPHLAPSPPPAPLQVQVEFDSPKNNKASVVYYGVSRCSCSAAGAHRSCVLPAASAAAAPCCLLPACCTQLATDQPACRESPPSLPASGLCVHPVQLLPVQLPQDPPRPRGAPAGGAWGLSGAAGRRRACTRRRRRAQGPLRPPAGVSRMPRPCSPVASAHGT